jgi:hypothetical protein
MLVVVSKVSSTCSSHRSAKEDTQRGTTTFLVSNVLTMIPSMLSKKQASPILFLLLVILVNYRTLTT